MKHEVILRSKEQPAAHISDITKPYCSVAEAKGVNNLPKVVSYAAAPAPQVESGTSPLRVCHVSHRLLESTLN